jgi:hypothetical protein
MSSTATVSAESSIRSLIFGDATRSRAELVRSLGLSRQGRMAAASPGPGFPHALELMWEQMTPPPAMRIADLGAGLGGASAWMKDHGASVTAFELEAGALSGAQLLFPDLDIHQGDAQTVGLGSFEAATAFGLLSLSHCPTKLLRSIATRLGADLDAPTRWIASIDLVACGNDAVLTSRNCFLPVDTLASSIPQWTLVKHCVLEQEERSPLWRDVSIAVEIALQSFDRSNAMSALRTDREELQRLIDQRRVQTALTLFSSSVGQDAARAR